jgi:hypothetical protein
MLFLAYAQYEVPKNLKATYTLQLSNSLTYIMDSFKVLCGIHEITKHKNCYPKTKCLGLKSEIAKHKNCYPKTKGLGLKSEITKHKNCYPKISLFC